ncbi:MAG: hypothetical protein AAF570_20745, partial [Bacteroidota bacterium]
MPKRIVLIIAFFSVLLPLQGQLSLSVYSRYGLGDLYNATSTRNYSMGNVGIGAYDGVTINRINPASYADIRLTTLEFSGFGAYSLQSSNTNTQNLGTAGIHNASLAFSNKKGFGFVMGIAPYSSSGYDVIVGDSVLTDSTYELYSTQYNADGGLNQFYIGAGFRFLKKFYAGANLTMAFGTTNYNWTNDFQNPALNSVNITDRTSVTGFLPQFGLQYGDTLRIRSKVDRRKVIESEIKKIDGFLAEIDKEEQKLAKDRTGVEAWEKKQNEKIAEIN